MISEIYLINTTQMENEAASTVYPLDPCPAMVSNRLVFSFYTSLSTFSRKIRKRRTTSWTRSGFIFPSFV